MLVLSRQTFEEIMLGDDITIKILGVKEGKVNVGIDCPPHIKITRPDMKKGPKPNRRPLSNICKSGVLSY